MLAISSLLCSSNSSLDRLDSFSGFLEIILLACCLNQFRMEREYNIEFNDESAFPLLQFDSYNQNIIYLADISHPGNQFFIKFLLLVLH
jgi:hypothetical protein